MDPEAPGWDPKDRELYTLPTNLGHIYGAEYLHLPTERKGLIETNSPAHSVTPLNLEN